MFGSLCHYPEEPLYGAQNCHMMPFIRQFYHMISNHTAFTDLIQRFPQEAQGLGFSFYHKVTFCTETISALHPQ